jgi:hypothetical protein
MKKNGTTAAIDSATQEKKMIARTLTSFCERAMLFSSATVLMLVIRFEAAQSQQDL